MKKSAALVAVPASVETEIRPEPVEAGTLVSSDVAVAALIDARVVLIFARLLLAVVSKFVPVIVTAVPAVPIVGVKLVIVGEPGSPTMNDVAL